MVSSRIALVTTTAVLLMILAAAGPAAAIFNGGPDGNGHPNVGAVLAAQAFSDGTWTECTGTLVSPDVRADRGPLSDGRRRDRVAVTFDSEYHSSTGTPIGAPGIRDPRFRHPKTIPTTPPSSFLDRPYWAASRRRELPEAGSLANLDRGTRFTSVGYGAQFITTGKGGQVFHYTDTRYVAVNSLTTQSRTWLRDSQNPALGYGGTCTGDSGGPNFLGAGSSETNILAATTITGDAACHSTSVDLRLDTASARWFLEQYVSLP